MCPPRERTTDNSRLDHCFSTMDLLLISNCSGDKRPPSSDDIPAVAEPPNRVVHEIQIRRVMRLVGRFNKVRNICLTSVVQGAILAVYTQVTSLMTCGYFRSIIKEYISTRQIFFINRLTIKSAVYFNANVTILG